MGVRFPSRHHLKYQYPLWIQSFAALVSALRSGYFGLATALRYEIGYSVSTLFSTTRIRLQRTLFLLVLLFTPDYVMRSGLGSDQVLAMARVFTALFPRSDGSLPKFPFLGIGRGRNYQMKIRTAAEI